MVPQLEVGGWAPRPMKLRLASATSAIPKVREICKNGGEKLLGMRLRHTIRLRVHPMASQASIDVVAATAMVVARWIRKKRGEKTMPIAIIAWFRLVPRAATIATARMIPGT